VQNRAARPFEPSYQRALICFAPTRRGRRNEERSAGAAGLVKFGSGGKDLWQRFDRLRAGPSARSGLVRVRPELVAVVRYFGRYRTGWIRDGVLLSVG